ncbi:MAG: hypothetical protein IIA49_11225 [Bacteroidetes bacterium]|nr:hypothetical protein [Bacteroidota bacterium]MCH7771566.1 hypothetical protein [Bacteroidota bacterium]
MSSIDEVLKSLGDEVLDSVKTEFINLLSQAKDEQIDFVNETAEKIEKWLIMRVNGEFDDDELEALLNARKRVVRQNLNTLEIQSRARVEKIVFGIIDIVTNKLLNKIL